VSAAEPKLQPDHTTSVAPWAPAPRHTAIFCLLLVAATLAFYNPIVHNRFIDFDDSAYIVKNVHVQSGLTWSTVKWSLTTFQEGNWHPLTWWSHALDCQVFHLNPAGHHYTNLLLHAASAVLLFLLLQRATGCTWASLMVAGLFALHPVNVESVAWAAERKNVLSMLLCLLALAAYDRYARSGRRLFYVAVAVLFALGLMAKPQIVTLPFVLLLWDYWPLKRMAGVGLSTQFSEFSDSGSPALPRRFTLLIWEKWPLFLLAAADSVITVIAQRSGNTVRTLTEVSLSARVENIFVSYARYLGKAFWPTKLVPMYPHPHHSLHAWQVAGAIALLVAISVLVVRWREHRYLLMGWCWFLGTLVPMIGIITVGEQAMADRYAYLPFIGLFIAVVWGVRDLFSEYKLPKAVLLAGATAVLVICGFLTYRQLGHWSDDETLWRYTLSVTERNYVAHNDLAIALAKAGRSDEAVVEFRAARMLHKYPADQIVKLAVYELRMGHAREAVEECQAALEATSDPRMREVTLTQMARALLQLGQYDQAAERYHEALQLSPADADALIGSGALALRAGDFNQAIAHLSEAAKVQPNDVNFLLLAQALHQSGQTADADRAFEQAQRVSSNFAEAWAAANGFLAMAGVKPL
jgi:tetratricopeptide (TPR) repeat protein